MSPVCWTPAYFVLPFFLSSLWVDVIVLDQHLRKLGQGPEKAVAQDYCAGSQFFCLFSSQGLTYFRFTSNFMHSQGWTWTSFSLASNAPVLRFQACTTRLDLWGSNQELSSKSTTLSTKLHPQPNWANIKDGVLLFLTAKPTVGSPSLSHRCSTKHDQRRAVWGHKIKSSFTGRLLGKTNRPHFEKVERRGTWLLLYSTISVLEFFLFICFCFSRQCFSIQSLEHSL